MASFARRHVIGIQPHGEACQHGFLERAHVIGRDALGLRMRGDEIVHQIAGGVVQELDHVGANVLGHQQARAKLIDDGALLVHDVVEFERVFADAEVALLDAFLRVLDGLVPQRMFELLAFLHAQPLHDARDAVGAEQAHQIVLERDIEARRARVALAAGPPAQLPVNAARLMPFGADDAQAAQLGHARPQLDVSAAPGHVGGDRHRAALARARGGAGAPRPGLHAVQPA